MPRTRRAMINTSASVAAQLLTILFKFVIRRVFIFTLGIELLGYNGLFANILNLLCLADLGVGAALVFNLYKPLEQRDETAVRAAISVFRRSFSVIGLFVLGAGLCAIPLLPLIVREQIADLPFIAAIYCFHLANTAVGYFFAHTRSLLAADQSSYAASLCDSLVGVLFLLAQLASLLTLRSYWLYLSLMVLQTLASNAALTIYCRKKYPFLRKKPDRDAVCAVRGKLGRDVKNVMVSRLGGFVFSSTDNLVISKLLGVTVVGVYSNYYMIYVVFQNLVTGAIGSMSGSVGSLLASPDGKKAHAEQTLFRMSFLVHLVMCCFIVPAIWLTQPFIRLWLGSESYMLPWICVLLLCVNTYLYVLQFPAAVFCDCLGYFRYEKPFVLVSAAVNLGLSIWLAGERGVAGVLLGTLVATLFYWLSRAGILYRRYFTAGVRRYAGRGVFAVGMTALSVLLGYLAQRWLPPVTGIPTFILTGAVLVLLTLAVNLAAFCRTEELAYWRGLLLQLLRRGRSTP